MEKLRNGHIAIEDQTRHYVRPLGAYVIKTEGPNSESKTPFNATYREAVREAKKLTPDHKVVTLSGPAIEHETTALD